MRHDPRLRPGPLLRQLAARQDGEDIQNTLNEMTKALDGGQQYHETLQFQRKLFGLKYDVKIVFDITGAKPNSQVILLNLTANNWDNDVQTRINEGFDVSIDRAGNAIDSRHRGKTTISCGSCTEITLPIVIPAVVIDQMVGKPLGEFAEQTGILRHYKERPIKQVLLNHPDDPARAEILLDGLAWDAGVSDAYYRALRASGEDLL